MLTNKKILIADDTSTMRSLMKGVLIRNGFTDIDEAENGQAVMQKLAQQPYQLVICDWNMPVMDGLEVLKTMRANDAFSKIPFMCVTAIADASKVVFAIQQGVDDYIIKPLKPDDFARRVIELVK